MVYDQKHTILGGSARSAALPFLVRLNNMLFKILCFNRSIAPLPPPVFPESCIGVAIFWKSKHAAVSTSHYVEYTKKRNPNNICKASYFIPPAEVPNILMSTTWAFGCGTVKYTRFRYLQCLRKLELQYRKETDEVKIIKMDSRWLKFDIYLMMVQGVCYE